MHRIYLRRFLLVVSLFASGIYFVHGQAGYKLKYSTSSVYAGIEVGSKGIKMSLVETHKTSPNRSAFNILKDTSINTDFISFSEPTFHATLVALYVLYETARTNNSIPTKNIFTVISSGVKTLAEKENKTNWISKLIDSFKIAINDPGRIVEVVDVLQEGRLSHLGIVPDAKRYVTFLIDIGSGNTKGGFFPYGNTKNFKLFQVGWGTKSTANATEKRCENDKSLANFNKQLTRVAFEAENSEIIYAVNESGSYPLSDIVAFSGGIAWSLANLIHPEQFSNTGVQVTYNDVVKFSEKLYSNFAAFSDSAITKNISDTTADKEGISKEVKRVLGVFDQRSLMAGTALMLKIMRQFISIYETKEFLLVKNGQVGWISAYVDQNISK